MGVARRPRGGRAGGTRTVGEALRFAPPPPPSAEPLLRAICGSFTVLQFGQRIWYRTGFCVAEAGMLTSHSVVQLLQTSLILEPVGGAPDISCRRGAT